MTKRSQHNTPEEKTKVKQGMLITAVWIEKHVRQDDTRQEMLYTVDYKEVVFVCMLINFLQKLQHDNLRHQKYLNMTIISQMYDFSTPDSCLCSPLVFPILPLPQ